MNEALLHIQKILTEISSELNSKILGQEKLIKNLIITIFAGGHALLEWAPGLGKTRTIRAISEIFSLDHKRISFTPDLLPSDLIGSEIYRPNSQTFEIRKGPIFTHILLADEINRTPPKVQSALLEAMEERQITIANETISLPQPFFVFATQNPLEHDGTYPLPEAQLDRFFMKIDLSYPDIHNEKKILANSFENKKSIKLSGNEITEIQNFIKKSIKVDEKIIDYVARILSAFRRLTEEDFLFNSENPLLDYGPSTRAGMALISGAQISAIFSDRDFVLPEDIKSIAHEIINHRIGLSYYAETEKINKKMITTKILDSIDILS